MCAFVLPVRRSALGFLHSGVLITGSHVSCSHLFPSPLPHLFIPERPLHAPLPSPPHQNIPTGFLFFGVFLGFIFKREPPSTSKTEAARVNLLLLFSNTFFLSAAPVSRRLATCIEPCAAEPGQSPGVPLQAPRQTRSTRGHAADAWERCMSRGFWQRKMRRKMHREEYKIPKKTKQ